MAAMAEEDGDYADYADEHAIRGDDGDIRR